MSSQPSSLQENGILRGALTGLIPLGLLVVIIVIVLLLTVLARQLVATSGFFVQEQTVLFIVIPGLILAIVVYAVALWLTMRHVALWQQEGAELQARATLWALGITALIVLLPVVLALVIPQHPAP